MAEDRQNSVLKVNQQDVSVGTVGPDFDEVAASIPGKNPTERLRSFVVTVSTELREQSQEARYRLKNGDGFCPLMLNETEQKQGDNSGKRVRGTAKVLRRGALLLVQEQANDHYSLPGGAHENGEPWMCTAVRELKEELNLDVRTAERLTGFDFHSKHRAHRVSLLTTDQDPCGRTYFLGYVKPN
ncbi:MAG: NUDIX domain-containing protein [Spirochaeta sp.]|jgi:hypothetical protein|nr:NUDIX domain-containing protein [Spirochaeta sp.]